MKKDSEQALGNSGNEKVSWTANCFLKFDFIYVDSYVPVNTFLHVRLTCCALTISRFRFFRMNEMEVHHISSKSVSFILQI